jgi:HD-GYP domain-containing protein (c-di-GMP phosphodiesterase class II)
MISIPAEILSKPGRISKIEMGLIKAHAQASHDVLCRMVWPWPVATVALQHHERLDGSGYPNGLRGVQIIPEAHIMAVADVVEAMSSHRPYRASLGIDRALAEIENGSGALYDADAVKACHNLFRNKGFELPN